MTLGADKSFVTDWLETDIGKIARVSSEITATDRLGAMMVRCAVNRNDYKIAPGIYAVGNPDADSPVMVSANYKLSFDHLRKELGGLDAWIMVLDTKGINVWCAAGKGTFGTEEIVNRIKVTDLEKLVNHRQLIVPQLGAVGVAAHEVKKASGFTVIYGPIRARDIKTFLRADCKADDDMRQVHFFLRDRLIVTPVEIMMGLKYLLAAVIAAFVLSGLNRSGYSLDLALTKGSVAALNIIVAYVTAMIVAPAMLPWLPGRSFAVKGAALAVVLFAVMVMAKTTGGLIETVGWFFIIVALLSFVTLCFTGSSTYTSLSGVNKEIKIAVPLNKAAAAIGILLWITARFVY